MKLPVFTPRDPPKVEWKNEVRIDVTREARCRLCPEPGPVDDESGLGVGCWRVLVALPVVLDERAANPVRVVDPRGPGIIGSHWIEPSPAAAARPRNAVTSASPPPADELGVARTAREVPRLTDQSGPGGVVVDVALEPPPRPNLGPRRRRP